MHARDEGSAGPQRPWDTTASPGRDDERTGEARHRPGAGDERTTATAAGRDATAPADEPPHMGQIGRFIVLRRLGAGGMGVVYLAYDNVLDRKVAVKVIRGLSAPDPEKTQRMQREARAMAKLSHPNVLQIYEVGESEGSLFLAMEYVQGGPLSAWLSGHGEENRPEGASGGRPDWRAIVAMFVQAGRGLAAAHQAGLVHRDFKPDNVLVGDDGVARVADFGIARLLEGSPHEPGRMGAEQSLLATLTGTHAVMGTPAYMSPEQHAGLPTDARTDQFSFCVALWEALHGERPFTGDSLEELARAIERGVPIDPPAGSRVPAWLRAALVRGLAVAPERRWPSMSALLAVLTDDPVARRRRRALAAVAVATLVVTLATLAHFTLEGRSRAEVEAQRAASEAQRAEVASDERDRALALAQREAMRARDGLRMLALRTLEHDATKAALLLQEVEDPEGTVEWMQAATATLATPLSAAVLRGHAHWVRAADFLGERDEYVVTVSLDRTARVSRSDGVGDAQVLVHKRSLYDLVVAPDRRSFVALGDRSAVLWTLGAAPDEPLIRRGEFPGDPDSDSERAAFTPDGQRLATTDSAGAVRLWDVASGRLLARLGSHETPIFAVAFDPAGGRLFTGDDRGGLRQWSVDGGAHGRLPDLGELVFALHVDADGRVLSAASTGAQVWSARRSRRVVFGHTGEISDAAVSPDGREFATASRDRTARRWDAATGEELARLEHPGPVEGVRYSPDGRWLVTLLDEHVRLWRRDNRHVMHELHGHVSQPTGAVFSRDGARLLTYSPDQTARVWDLGRLTDTMLFHASKEGLYEVYGGCDVGRVAALGEDGVLRLWQCDDRPARELRLSKRTISQLEVDPALTRGVYADEDGVWVVSLPDGRPRRVGVHPVLGWSVALSPDGRYLISTGYDHTARIWDLRGEAPPVVLVGHTAPVVWDAAWSPDGATVATIGNDVTVRIWSVGHVLSDTNRGSVELEATHVFTGHQRGAKTVAFDPSGARVLTSSPDATARIWDPAGVAAPIVLAGHRGKIYTAAWSPDGRRVATASEDGTARIWPADASGPPLVLRGHRGEVASVAWSPDGRAVVTASDDGTARVWSVDSGVTSDVYVAGKPVFSAMFTRDGTHVLLAGADDTARLWRPGLDFRPDPAALLARLRAATTSCLTARDRELVLLEDDMQSRARHAACEVRHRRTPDDNEGVMRGPAETGFRQP